MAHVSETPRPDEQVAHHINDDGHASVGEPTRFPVLFAVIAGVGLIILCTMIVEFVVR